MEREGRHRSESGEGIRRAGGIHSVCEGSFDDTNYSENCKDVSKIDERKLLRIIDANFNRAKEGLRVCEDICRFILDDPAQTRQFKTLRHRLSAVIAALPLGKLIECRNIDGDVGKKSTAVELKRKNISDIFYANSQRIKESLRVLEEFTKLLNRTLAEDLKKIRYQIYALEKKVVAQFKKSVS